MNDLFTILWLIIMAVAGGAVTGLLIGYFFGGKNGHN
jgi:hypothetical protein